MKFIRQHKFISYYTPKPAKEHITAFKHQIITKKNKKKIMVFFDFTGPSTTLA